MGIVRNVFLAMLVASLAAACSSVGNAPQRSAELVQPREQVIRQNLPGPAVGVPQGEVFHWRTVGGDPCNPAVGCTLEWALEQAGYSPELQRLIIEAVRTQKPTEVMIARGWRGWMTWGKVSRKFHPNTVADFNQMEPAQQWAVAHGSKVVKTVRVRECKNWGGYTEEGPPPPPQPTGGTPLVSCP